MFVKTATNEKVEINGKIVQPLTFWGDLVGVDPQQPAEQAEYIITVNVVNQVGSLDSQTQLVSAENGVTYLTLGSVALNASTVQVTVRASADQGGGDGSGTVGNLEVGISTLSFANPLPNVERDALVITEVVRGSDAETTEEYRQRVVDRFQKRPQGGAPADYELWGEEVVGIINVYPYTGNPGEVNVYSEATPESSGNPDGIPTQAQLDAVLQSIEFDDNGLASRRPINDFVNSLPITRTGFDVLVSGVSVPANLGQVQADIESAVTTFFLDREPFIAGLTIPPRTDKITRSALIGLVEDIVTAANGTFNTVQFNASGFPTPLEIYILGEGEKSKAESIAFS